MNLKDTYNKIARDWHKDHQTDDWWIDGAEKFISFLKQGNRVLDVGCGDGVKSAYLFERGLQVTGIDFSENFIEIAKEENPHIDFKIMDMGEVSMLEDCFDGVYASALLLHVPRKDMCANLNKLALKVCSGGVIYIAVKGIASNGVKEELKVENDYGYSYERFFSYYSMDELLECFEKLGLKIIYQNIKKSGKTDWLEIVGRK